MGYVTYTVVSGCHILKLCFTYLLEEIMQPAVIFLKCNRKSAVDVTLDSVVVICSYTYS